MADVGPPESGLRFGAIQSVRQSGGLVSGALSSGVGIRSGAAL